MKTVPRAASGSARRCKKTQKKEKKKEETELRQFCKRVFKLNLDCVDVMDEK